MIETVELNAMKLENLLSGDKRDQRPAYIRADAELRVDHTPDLKFF